MTFPSSRDKGWKPRSRVEMSMYEIGPKSADGQGITLVSLSGRAEAETVLRLLDELSTLAEGNGSLRVLIDETGLGPGFVGPTDIQKILVAWRRATSLRTTRVAVLASNLAIYGLNRMFQGLAGRDAEGRVRLFTNRAPATTWLLEAEGLPQEQVAS
jgi:hypothetical protein